MHPGQVAADKVRKKLLEKQLALQTAKRRAGSVNQSHNQRFVASILEASTKSHPGVLGQRCLLSLQDLAAHRRRDAQPDPNHSPQVLGPALLVIMFWREPVFRLAPGAAWPLESVLAFPQAVHSVGSRSTSARDTRTDPGGRPLTPGNSARTDAAGSARGVSARLELTPGTPCAAPQEPGAIGIIPWIFLAQRCTEALAFWARKVASLGDPARVLAPDTAE